MLARFTILGQRHQRGQVAFEVTSANAADNPHGVDHSPLQRDMPPRWI